MNLKFWEKKEVETTSAESKASTDSSSFSVLSTVLKPVLLISIFGMAAGYFIVSPQVDQISQLEKKVRELRKMRNELAQNIGQVEILKAELEQSKRNAQKALLFFYSPRELDELFESLANVAGENALKVVSFSKQASKPVQEQSRSGKKLKDVLYYERDIDLVLRGDFRRYLEFRNNVSNIERVVDTSREMVAVDSNAEPGIVNIELKLRTYSLEDGS